MGSTGGPRGELREHVEQLRGALDVLGLIG